MRIPYIRKAITAAAAAAGSALTAASLNGSVTTGEWVSVVVSGLIGGLAVYQIPNRKDHES